MRRIERKVDAGADADLEYAFARLNVHPLDRLETAGVKRGSEDEVVDFREFVVDALDEIILDGCDRQCARPGIATGNELIFRLVLPIE
jgi:hypothetical protein